MELQGVLADRDSWAASRCSVARALEIVGTRSALLLMREAYYGATRFDEFARRVGISEAVAAQRLRELVEHGLLVKRPYREPGQRARDEYVLTEMGHELAPALIALMQWGDRWLTGTRGAPLTLTHTDCGAHVRAELRCAAGHVVDDGDIAVRVNGRR